MYEVKKAKKDPIVILIVILISIVTSIGGIMIPVAVFDKQDIKEMLTEYKRQGDILQGMVANQEKIDDLKINVNSSIKDVKESYQEVIRVLGLILQGHGIVFPNELSLRLSELRGEMDALTDSLIVGG